MTDLTNQYTPRSMIAAMIQKPRPTSFLQDMTGVNNNIQRHNTKVIEIDKVFGNQLVAGYVARHGKANALGKRGYENHFHVAPYLKEMFSLTDEDTEVRDPGTTIYDGIGSFMPKLGKGLDELRDRFRLVDEVQLADAMNTGTITIQGEGVDYVIDFDQAAAHLVTLTSTDLWSDTTNSDPSENLREWAELIDDKGAPNPEWVIGDTTAMRAFTRHPKVTGALDLRRVENGGLNYSLLRQQRATYIGRWVDIGVDVELYSYNGYYETSDGSTITQNRFMPAGTVFMGSSMGDMRKHFAKISNVKARDLNFFADQFPLIIEPDDGSSISVQLESSPMIGMHQPNAFVRAKVLA